MGWVKDLVWELSTQKGNVLIINSVATPVLAIWLAHLVVTLQDLTKSTFFNAERPEPLKWKLLVIEGTKRDI